MQNIDREELIKLIKTMKSKGFIYNEAHLCKKSGVPHSYLSDMKSGRRPVSEEMIQRIIVAFPDFFNNLQNECTVINQTANNNKAPVSQSAGDMTINYGRSEKEIEDEYEKDRRGNVMFSKMLDMIQEAYDKLSEIDGKVEERNKLSDKMLDIIKSKDEQIALLINKIGKE